MPTYINLTPHAINLHTADGSVQTFAPSGAIARAAETRASVGTLDGVAVELVSFGAVENLPAPQAGTFYIVSGLVLAAAQDRPDLLAPGQPVRDDAGRVIGCKGWTCTPAFAQPQPPPPAPKGESRPSPAMPPSYMRFGRMDAPRYTPPQTTQGTAIIARSRWNGVGMAGNALPFEFRVGAATYWCDDRNGRGAWRDAKGRPMDFNPSLKGAVEFDMSYAADAEAIRARALAFAETHNFPPDGCAGNKPASAVKLVGSNGEVEYDLYRADGSRIWGYVPFGTWAVPVTETRMVSDQQAAQNAETMNQIMDDLGMLSAED